MESSIADMLGTSSPRRTTGLGNTGGANSTILGMTNGTSIRQQLDSLSATMHETVGRLELAGRQIINLEEDR